MIYFLHGNDAAASRGSLSDLTNGFQATVLDGKTLSVANLEENLVSSSLFDEKKTVVVEGLIGKNKKKKEIVEWLNGYNGLVLIVFWEDGKIRKNSIPVIKGLVIKEFTYPDRYFQFLDSFIPGNSRNLYKLHQEVLRSMAETQVFYSLLKRIRQLLILSCGNHNGLEEFSKMSPWQLEKLKKQVSYWKKPQLTNFYSYLQDTEIKLKSGGLPVSLSKHLDILILSEI